MITLHLRKFLKIILMIITIDCVAANKLNGPFLLWGIEDLKELEAPALSEIDENVFVKIISNSDLILIFSKSNTIRLNDMNFPCLYQLVSTNQWVYFPQSELPVDPSEYNLNVKTFELNNISSVHNDKFLCEIFEEETKTYGKNILGILTNSVDYNERIKRSTTKHVEEEIHPEKLNHIFYRDENDKILLYSKDTPLLKLEGIGNEHNNYSFELEDPENIEIFGNFDESTNYTVDMTIDYKHLLFPGENITLQLQFETFLGYWSLNPLIEVKTVIDTYNLSLKGIEKFSAPHGFSYCCHQNLTFADEKGNSLIFRSIQIEPQFWKSDHHNETYFNDSYNCVGFVSVPILAGIFVCFLLLLLFFIGIIMIMEIKTPTRFDNSKTKMIIIVAEEDKRNKK